MASKKGEAKKQEKAKEKKAGMFSKLADKVAGSTGALTKLAGPSAASSSAPVTKTGSGLTPTKSRFASGGASDQEMTPPRRGADAAPDIEQGMTRAGEGGKKGVNFV